MTQPAAIAKAEPIARAYRASEVSADWGPIA